MQRSKSSTSPDQFLRRTAGPPVVPDGAQPSPQHSISGSQSRVFHGSLKNAELMPERRDLKLKRRTAPE